MTSPVPFSNGSMNINGTIRSDLNLCVPVPLSSSKRNLGKRNV